MWIDPSKSQLAHTVTRRRMSMNPGIHQRRATREGDHTRATVRRKRSSAVGILVSQPERIPISPEVSDFVTIGCFSSIREYQPRKPPPPTQIATGAYGCLNSPSKVHGVRVCVYVYVWVSADGVLNGMYTGGCVGVLGYTGIALLPSSDPISLGSGLNLQRTLCKNTNSTPHESGAKWRLRSSPRTCGSACTVLPP